jgi:predicted ATPase
MNGMGKSSVIQALLLLRQSYWSDNGKGLHGLQINGGLIKLGTSAGEKDEEQGMKQRLADYVAEFGASGANVGVGWRPNLQGIIPG